MNRLPPDVPLSKAVASVLVAVVLAGAIGAAVGGRPGAEGAPTLARSDVSAPAAGVFRQTDPQAVRQFAQWLGRPLDVVVDFSARDTWEQIAYPGYMLDTWSQEGLQPVYAVAMLPEQDGTATMQRGAAGEYDDYYRTLAGELVDADQGHAVLRVGWEFNLAGSRWATPDTESFIAYWRRIVESMRSVEGQRFRFDWNVNNGDGNRYDALDYYPGDDVVDYIGVDVYDQSGRDGTYPYPVDCDDLCRHERQRAAWDRQIHGGERGLGFWRDFAVARAKPMSLPEWGLWARPDGTGGGDNPFFIERMHEFITDPDNGVAYHAYFEYDGADGEHTLREAFPRSGELFRWLWSREVRYA